MASELVSDVRAVECDLETYSFFLHQFFELFDSQVSGVREISIAIRGFGRFAAPTRKFLGVAELKKVSFDFFENFFFINENFFFFHLFIFFTFDSFRRHRC